MERICKATGTPAGTDKARIRQLISVEIENSYVKDRYVCTFCNKSFGAKSTLNVHLCEPRRRQMQKTDRGVTLGLHAFRSIYHNHMLTYDEFAKSSMYTELVKVGQTLVQYRTKLTKEYIDYVIRHNVRIELWAKDFTFERFVVEYIKSEEPESALIRTITELQSLAEEDDADLTVVIKTMSSADVIKMIVSGKISPWFLYCCESGIAALTALILCDVKEIKRIIDPDFWSAIFIKYEKDVNNIKKILSDGGF